MHFPNLVKEVKRRNSKVGTPVGVAFVCQALIEAMEEGKPFNEGLILHCLSRARELERLAPKQETKKTSGTESDIRSPLLAKSVFRVLDDEVEKIRRELFDDNPNAPFEEWSEAVAWIIQQKAEGAPQVVDWEQADQLMERRAGLAREVERLTGEQIVGARKFPHLDIYSESGGHVSQHRQIPVKMWNRRLRRLLNFVDGALSTTGLSRDLSLLYLLVGKKRLPGISVKLSNPSPGTIAMTTIKIPRLTPSWEDMQTVYKLLRSLRGKHKAPDLVSREVARSISDRGGVPSKGKGEFWGLIADDVHEKKVYGLEKKLSPEAVRMRYRRLPEEWRLQLQA